MTGLPPPPFCTNSYHQKSITYDLTDYGYNEIETHRIMQYTTGMIGNPMIYFVVTDLQDFYSSVHLIVSLETGEVFHSDKCV